MKKLLMAAAIGAAGLVGTGAQAATTNGSFNVDITLTSACSLGTITAVDFAYTSGQAGPQPSTGGGFNITCTNTLPYSFSIEQPLATPAVFPATDTAVNLDYTLTPPGAGVGNGAAQPLTITGNMPGGQAGTCAAASCTNAAATNRTYFLVVTY